MHWTLWILASAVFLAFYDIAKKASVRGNAVLPTLLLSTCFGCAAFTAFWLLRGGSAAEFSPTPSILAVAALKSAIVATSWIFTFCALRTLPISIATPIRASAPALVFLIAFFLYGEVPGIVQALGMATVFAGYFVFSWAGSHEGIDFFRSRAVWCAIAGAFFSAVSAIWDKYVFQVMHAPVETVQLLFQIGLVVFYGAALCVQRLCGWNRDRFEWRWTIPLVGTLLAFADWLYFKGLAIDGVAISAASLMRRFSVVITFVVGAAVFRERNLLRKGLALAAILAGVVLLCLG